MLSISYERSHLYPLINLHNPNLRVGIVSPKKANNVEKKLS